MTVQEEVRQRIEHDALLARLRKKIDSGKGTFDDSFAYSDRAGRLLGEIFAQRLPGIPPAEREALCVELLRDRYTDINSLCDAVQKALDQANGLHLRPQRAPFEEARAHKIGHSTADQTVPEKTQQRRSRSATETMTRSMHDDRMQAEAKFRSRAGLKCYITRKTDGKCCAWCSAMAGRYEYYSEPKDVYRRHDNCGCSVTYENGRQRQDVWSKRTWEAPEPGAGAGDPVVFTKEQARELEAKHLPEVLTNGEKHDIMNIRLDDIKTAVTGSPISEEVAEYIFSVLAEQRDQFKFDSVRVLALDPKIVMQTDPVQNGTFYDIVLNLNSNFLGGRSVEELDEKLRQSNYTRANSLREAVIHEIYHGRLLYDKNAGEMKALHEILDDEHIDGVSPTAFKNGFECISEVGVLYERGETADIPQKARDLFHYYMRR